MAAPLKNRIYHAWVKGHLSGLLTRKNPPEKGGLKSGQPQNCRLYGSQPGGGFFLMLLLSEYHRA